MRVVMIGALAVLFLAILIGSIIYDRKVKNKRHAVMHALWRLVHVKYETPALNPIEKLRVMEACPEITVDEFRIVVYALEKQGVLIVTDDSIGFTGWGAQYYEFKVKPEVIRG